MNEVRRYLCTIQFHTYRIKVNVFSNQQDDVVSLAKIKAARHIKQLYRLPVELVDLDVVQVTDMGTDPEFIADKLVEGLMIAG